LRSAYRLRDAAGKRVPQQILRIDAVAPTSAHELRGCGEAVGANIGAAAHRLRIEDAVPCASYYLASEFPGERSEERRVGKKCDWSSDVCSSDLFDLPTGCVMPLGNGFRSRSCGLMPSPPRVLTNCVAVEKPSAPILGPRPTVCG